MSKPAKRMPLPQLPEPLADHLDWLVDAVLKGAGKLPPGYHRSNIKLIVRSMAKRSISDHGPDLLPDTFINPSS
ncbi:hypothetical protein [Bradyrhizobium sp.]|uniref:hypothetical protein n=1 Tax=Bradyrhizobium sp. TaxID=376 RepID=UPI0039E29E20